MHGVMGFEEDAELDGIEDGMTRGMCLVRVTLAGMDCFGVVA